MKIRDAALGDIETFLALQKESQTASQWSVEQYRQAIEKVAPARVVLVVEEQSQILGFLVARTVVDEWEIENVIVAEGVRRRGLGGHLIAEILNRAQIARAITVMLEVRESNSAARCLYEAYGFKPVGRRALYYHAPSEDAVLYEFKFS